METELRESKAIIASFQTSHLYSVQGERENPIALVQLADAHMVVLVHISRMGWQGKPPSGLILHIFRCSFTVLVVPTALKTLLEDPDILKLGVGINGKYKFCRHRSISAAQISASFLLVLKGDKTKVFRDLNISLEGCLELSQLARNADYRRWAERTTNSMVSLAKLTEIYVLRILQKPKKLQRGNWEASLGHDMQNCKQWLKILKSLAQYRYFRRRK